MYNIKMNTIFMYSEKSKPFDPHRLLLNLTDKVDMRRKDKYIALSNRKNTKKSYKNNKFKIPAPTWNEEFELPDGSCSISDIHNCIEYIFKNIGEKQLILQ